MIMCPEIIFAKRRIIKAKGLVKMPMTSTGHMIGLTPQGTGEVDDVAPIMLSRAEHDGNKGQDAEHPRKSDIAHDVGRPGDKPDQGIHQNEEEDRQQKRHILFIAVAQVGLPHFIPDEDDNGLYHILEPARRGFYALPLVVFGGHTGHDPDQQNNRNDHLHRITPEGKIIHLYGRVHVAGIIHRNDLTG